MFTLKRKPLAMPSPDKALPGRAQAIPTAETHFVSGAPLKALFGLGCFWGAERTFWQLPGVTVTAVGYAGGLTPNPTYEEVCSGLTGHNEAVLVVYDPKQVSYEQLLKLFWESHDPTQGMRQGNDVGTQYRSGIYYFNDAQRREAQASKDGARARADHHRDPAGAGVLFRRGLPPAISRQEPARPLRAGRHGRVVPDRHRGRRLTVRCYPSD
jgi:peptide-methionine (S)-S-oxide reductase